MNEDQTTDLKQFITNVVRTEIGGQISDQTQHLGVQFDELKTESGKLKDSVIRLETKVDDLELKVDTIAEAFGVTFEEHTIKLDDHENRLTRHEPIPVLVLRGTLHVKNHCDLFKRCILQTC
ncbi:MAG: hypothetical protein WBO35_04525 [Candidatus Saccharimonadales bacterium]